MKCLNCEKDINKKDRFCPNCGAPQEANAKFCAVCGESTKKVTEITTENMAINGTNAAAVVSDG